MRPAVPLLAALSLALAACSTPCKELGAKLCDCVGGGTARDNCLKAIDNQLKDASPTTSDENYCSSRLSSCSAPGSVIFCEWVNTRCGKASCGLSNELPADPGVCSAAP
jgi:hypothetical protein